MKNRSKKFKIITAAVVVYLLVAVALLCRDNILKIGVGNTDQTKTQTQEPVAYDYDGAYQNLTNHLSYDLSQAPMNITKSDCASVIGENQLPALERMKQEDSEELMSELQVLKKIEKLQIDTKAFETPEFNWKNLYNTVSDRFAKEHVYSNQATFTGNRASELNQFIASQDDCYITISSDQLILDQGIVLKSNIGLNGNGVKLVAGNAVVNKAIVARDCTNVSLSSIELEDGGYEYGIYLINTSLFSIENCTVSKSVYKGIVIMGTTDGFVIRGNQVSGNGNGAVFLNGNIESGIIENNDIIENFGTRNLTAGLVLTSMEIEDQETAYNEFKDEYLYDLVNTPHNIVVYQNNVKKNNSSGIYSDGAYQLYVIDNTIFQNDKEGMCLDYGTFGSYVSNNIIKENGGRKRQTDGDLEADFVTAFGRLEDGSSPAKLPGVSIDNSAYNIIKNKNVTDNYGSGVKMVRSAYRNLIMENSVTDNDQGRSSEFHFFGIEIGHAKTPDEPVKGLDFTADYENIICRNIVSGSHYAGVFLAEDSYCNDIFDNVIMNSELFSIENHSTKFNSRVNNTKNKADLD